MKNLQRYLSEHLLIKAFEEVFPNLLDRSSYNGLKCLLEACFIIKNSRVFELPKLLPSDDHKRVIDKCIIFLLDHQLYNNVLTFGYSIARSSHVSSPLHCFSVNTQVARIKSAPWQILHTIIGTRNFVDILINHSLFEFNGVYFTQLVGNRLNQPHCPPSWCLSSTPLNREHSLLTPIGSKKFLYKSSLEIRFFNIFPSGTTVSSLFKAIFDPNCVKLSKSTVKRATPLLRKLIKNHRKSVKYMQILDRICPKIESAETTHQVELRTPTSKVLRFLIVVLEKLIPQEMFGSKRNKSSLFSKISTLLNLTNTGTLEFDTFIVNLRIKDFPWLLISDEHFSKHDFQYSSRLMHYFVSWFFRFLVPKIVSTFFYCTEVSSGVEILYFRHDSWNSISLPFLSGYLAENLIENAICRNHDSYLLSNYNHNRFRIIPKKAKGEFRVITFPHKGADEEERTIFKENGRLTTIPAQCVLEYLRSKRKTHFRKIYSVGQITNHIKDFKSLLLKKYKCIPKLYFMKFDMESCYDTIPRKKVLEVVQELLENESGFYIRSQTIFNPSNDSLKTLNVVNGNRKPVEGEVYVDNVRTTHLTNDDLINILEMELFRTALLFDGRCYLRKDGLFQGASFSALLVDLLYDDLLMKYKVFDNREEGESLVLRLADDFLVITNNESQIIQIKNTVVGGFPEYNARVKAEKMIYTHNRSNEYRSIDFCALNILLPELEIWKTPESLDMPKIHSLSTKKMYQRLLQYFEMRLSYGTMDSGLNSISAIIHQLDSLTSFIANAYLAAYNQKHFDLQSFQEFFEALFHNAVRSCLLSQQNSLIKKQFRLAIASRFLKVLLSHQSNFMPAIIFLRQVD